MPRPCCTRRVGFAPGVTYFKPAGVPLRFIEEVGLSLDELEALRLADLEGKYQEEAAKEMGVSRPTFGRIVEAARRKVAEALVKGKALRLEGGNITLSARRYFFCRACGYAWSPPADSDLKAPCPHCGNGRVDKAGDGGFPPSSGVVPPGGLRGARRRRGSEGRGPGGGPPSEDGSVRQGLRPGQSPPRGGSGGDPA